MDNLLFDGKRIANGYADEGFTFYTAKAEETGIPQIPYDIVTAAGVVDWVDKDKFLGNMKLVMAENAQILCQMQHEFDTESFIRFMMTQTNINSKIIFISAE